MLKLPIYLDNQATTRVDPRVVSDMMPFFERDFGNAGSTTHSFGWKAADACEEARDKIARFIGARSEEIVLTSGATEANNLAIKGLAETREWPAQIITSSVEHKSVIETCCRLERKRWRLTQVPVDSFGRVDPDDVAARLGDDTALVSVMAANNEVGTVQRLAEIGALCRARGVPFHTDATQAIGRLPVDVEKLQIDLLSLSAHKIYGPKGIGALYVRCRRPALRLERLLDGGSQESGMRAGTVAVPLAVGFGRACEICNSEMPKEVERLKNLRDSLYHGIRDGIPDVCLNGHPTERLVNNLSLSFPAVDPTTLMLNLADVAVSTGSACSAKDPRPSHVLTAMGLSADLAASTIRMGLGRFNTTEEVDYAIQVVICAAKQAHFARSGRPRAEQKQPLAV